MSEYKRMVSYLYKYERGAKGRNIGYVRVERRNGELRVFINMKDSQGIHAPYKVYFYYHEGRKIMGIPVGEMTFVSGEGSFRIAAKENQVLSDTMKLEDMGGMIIFYNTDLAYGTAWDDNSIYMNYFQPVSIKQNNSIEKKEDTPVVGDMPNQNNTPETASPLPTLIESQNTSQSIHTSQSTTSSGSEAMPETRVDQSMSEEKINQQISEQRSEEKENQRASGQRPEERMNQQTSGQRPEERMNQQTSGKRPKERINQQTSGQRPEERINQQVPEQRSEVKNHLPETEPMPNVDRKESQTSNHQHRSGMQNGNGLHMQQTAVKERAKAIDKHSPEMEILEPASMDVSKQEQRKTQMENVPLEVIEEKEEQKEMTALERVFKEGLKLPHSGNNQLVDCIKITPQDIGRLDSRNWKYGNNSFLLHGYYNYRYLILGKIMKEDGSIQNIVGVPGVYDNQSNYLACQFGFRQFLPSKPVEIKTGSFGYWIAEIYE